MRLKDASGVGEIKMSIQSRIREIKNGQWIKKGNEVFWQETVSTSEYDILLREWKKPTETTTLKTPFDMGLMKSFTFKIIVQDEERLSRFKSKKIFWLYECVVAVRPDKEHAYLKFEDKKLFLTDLWNGMTFTCPLKTNSDVVVELSEPIEISLDKAKEIAVEHGTQLYDSVTDEGEFGKAVTLRD